MALSVDDKTMLVDALATYRRTADLEPDTLARALHLQDELDAEADQQLARENGLDEHPPAARYNPEHGVPLDEYAAQFPDEDDADQDHVPHAGEPAEQATPREQVAQAAQDLAHAAQQVLKLYVFHGHELEHTGLHVLAQLSVATQDAAVTTLTALQQDPLR